jgi:hypothetical protein
MANPAASYSEYLRDLRALGASVFHDDEAATLREAADARLFDDGADAAHAAAETLLRRLTEHGRLAEPTAQRLAVGLAAITAVGSAAAA